MASFFRPTVWRSCTWVARKRSALRDVKFRLPIVAPFVMIAWCVIGYAQTPPAEFAQPMRSPSAAAQPSAGPPQAGPQYPWPPQSSGPQSTPPNAWTPPNALPPPSGPALQPILLPKPAPEQDAERPAPPRSPAPRRYPNRSVVGLQPDTAGNPENLPAGEAIPAPRGVDGRRNPAIRDSITNRNEEPLELVEFRDVSMMEAARMLSDQTGLKIVPSSEASKVKVSLYLRDVRPGVAIDALTKAHGLFYREDADTQIIRIYTTTEYEKDLGSFREESTEVFTLLYPNPLDVAYAIGGTFGDRVQLSINGQIVDSQQLQDLSQRFARLNLVDQQNRILGGFGGTTTGGGVGGFGGGGIGGGVGGFGDATTGGLGGGFGGGGTGLGGGAASTQTLGAAGNTANSQARSELTRLRNLTAEQIQALERIAGSSDQRAIDDLLRGRRADIFVTAVPRNNQLIVRTADLQSMKRIQELIALLDVPTPLVLLEVKVLALQLGDDFRSAFDYQFSDGQLASGGLTNNGTDVTTGNILPPAADAGGVLRTEPLSPGVSPNQNLTFQLVSSNFRMRMQFLESKNRVTQLATPLLMTANNEASRIFIGRTIPITIGFNPGTIVVSQGGQTVTSATPITSLQNIGQSLLITPNINADRTVTLRVAQENSALDGVTNIPVSDGTLVTSLPIDVVRRSTVTGTVVAKDGLTVAIGGLIQEELSDTRRGVPVIGKLPVIGILFRAQKTAKTRTELVVMIRPYVFNTPQESAALSHDLVRELSAHPHAPDAVGTMNSFSPQEILTAQPPMSPLQTIFRFHSMDPKVY